MVRVAGHAVLVLVKLALPAYPVGKPTLSRPRIRASTLTTASLGKLISPKYKNRPHFIEDDFSKPKQKFYFLVSFMEITAR